MNTMSNNDPVCCFREWMHLQEQDLSELHDALNRLDHGDQNIDDQLHQLVVKIIEHFQQYVHKRASLARENVSTYFAARWCTPLECSVLWIGGCRPSIFIRLLYSLIGKDIDSQLEEYLQGRRTGNFGDVSAIQMKSVDSLHAKTIREEDKLSARLAAFQEDVADDPISIIAKQARTVRCEPSKELAEAFEEHARSMLIVMEEADMLRLDTLKELIDILTPVQAVNFLAAGKKLHLCLHEWSRTKLADGMNNNSTRNPGPNP